MMDEERVYLDLGKGREVLPLPLRFDPHEFKFPGNSKELIPGLMWAVYDATSRTGAIWRARPRPHWMLIQPCLRADFFDRICPESVAFGFPDP